MSLIIGGLHTAGMVEVDVLAVIKQVNPDVYREWFEPGAGSVGKRVGPAHVTRFHCSLQAGMVVVGLKATTLARIEAMHSLNVLVLGT